MKNVSIVFVIEYEYWTRWEGLEFDTNIIRRNMEIVTREKFMMKCFALNVMKFQNKLNNLKMSSMIIFSVEPLCINVGKTSTWISMQLYLKVSYKKGRFLVGLLGLGYYLFGKSGNKQYFTNTLYKLPIPWEISIGFCSKSGIPVDFLYAESNRLFLICLYSGL